MNNRAALIKLLMFILALPVYAGQVRADQVDSGQDNTGQVHAGQANIVTRKIEGDYHEVAKNVRSAILGKGINIAHVLPASQMLHRTGSAYGYHTDVYADAETFEFCSAELSQKLSRADPENIVLCPFTISVYTLKSEPGIVRVSYPIPVGKPGSEKIVSQVVDLIESIIEDASW
jgi:uncharacterized protein (DUF302 family)